jgi:hypothetical protein
MISTLVYIAIHFVKPALIFMAFWATITATLILINGGK